MNKIINTKMKKILIIIIVFLFTTTVTSYAGFFTESSNLGAGEEIFDNYYGFFKSDNNYFSSGTSNDYYGFFRDSSSDPGGRPGNGGGIGQGAPIGDGLLVLTVCCAGLVIVKFFHRGKNNIKST